MRYKLIVLLAGIVVLTSLTGCVEDSWWYRHHHHHDDEHHPEIAVQIR